ncbi:MAG: ExbD/TolR family protein [Rubrivivax sp.]|nr:ExbD/TolR family protein [Rubrivivax sp.]MDH5339627.1 ExbD/TolR family protein [Rubrivivax sp.]
MPGVVSRGRGRRAMNEINMVPFIDVMLVLLIIFMVTAPLITTGVVDLPSVGQARQAAPQVVEVIVGTDERLQIRVRGEGGGDPQPVPLTALVAQVRGLQGGKADTPVVISADRNVKYDAVVRVMDRLQKAGVQRVGLSVAQGR